MIEWLFSWEVTSVVAVFFAGSALGLVALDDFRLAKLFFLIATADAAGGVVMGVSKGDFPTWLRTLLVFTLVGSIGILADQSLKYVNKKQKAKQQKPPIERTAKFAVLIPFDTAPKSMLIPMDENPDDPLYRTYAEFRSLAMNGTIPDDVRNVEGENQITWEAKPVSTTEATDFLARMLQYYVFQKIDNLQRDSMTVSIGYPAEAKAGIEPPDSEAYPYDRLLGDLGDNVFFKPFRHRQSGDEMTWRIKPVRMPKGTDIKLLQSSEGYVVRLGRDDYYVADFTVKAFVGTGVGNIPKHFVTPHSATIMQWQFIVTMRYSIQQPEDDNSFNPSNYAQWLDSLFNGLRKRLTLD